MNRSRLVAVAAGLWILLTAVPAVADPAVCVTYDFAGSELCVSENGIEDQGPLLPEPIWYCQTYTFSGAEICVSSYGQIQGAP